MTSAGIPYTVIVKRSAERDLRKLPAPILKKVIEIQQSLAVEPRPKSCKKLAGGMGYRVRVRDYRIVYTIDDKQGIGEIHRMRHRSTVYRNS